MPELWRPIPNYEGYYEVSNRGRVRRVGRKLIKPWTHKDGRVSVSLSKDGIRKTKYIHGLVLRAFRGPRPKGLVSCHHPDPNQTNNHLNNLRWDTRKENEQDKVKQGRKHGPRGSENGKLTKEQVLSIRQDNRTQKEIAKDYGLSQQGVSRIKIRKIWKHIE